MNENVYKTLQQHCADKRRFVFSEDNSISVLDNNMQKDIYKYILNVCEPKSLVETLMGKPYNDCVDELRNIYYMPRGIQTPVEEVANLTLMRTTSQHIGQSLINNQGRYIVRLKKMFIKDFGMDKLSETDYCKIATLIGDWVEKQKMTYEFVDNFDWKSGDFGDSGSCYWGSNAAARDTLQYYGSLAIRFWKNDKGCGRAWIAPLRSHVESDGAVVLFNRYGTPRDMGEFVRAVCKVADDKWYAHHVQVRNDAYRGGIIYTNGDAYLITPMKRESVSKVNLNMDYHDGTYSRANNFRCNNCGTLVDEDEHWLDPDGNILCELCFDRNCYECSYCGETAWKNNTFTTIDHEHVCQDCYDKSYTLCHRCGLAVVKEDALETSEGNRVCQGCAEIMDTCEHCGLYIESRTHTTMRGDSDETIYEYADLCLDCWMNHTFKCTTCGQFLYAGGETKDNAVCVKCKEVESDKEE